jgi:hypothetical protein
MWLKLKSAGKLADGIDNYLSHADFDRYAGARIAKIHWLRYLLVADGESSVSRLGRYPLI